MPTQVLKSAHATLCGITSCVTAALSVGIQFNHTSQCNPTAPELRGPVTMEMDPSAPSR
jgi:hypothetical protein